ncbi:hypothetical protein Aph01nite_11230 [Acrocarpospora phusangensis]|uniref:MucB/RseB N-terminal domain-containing protein n=1 Tax=Acrocarpospora phusangensis TaxID=1070424 RepID=A0A919Q8H7_9ACTN|nr:hypothetical protein [Acrocarpospora phusangensis]GIH22813.1 hypothetical protein Aph01nite_11230 [Acrocarpospora phusangensis]
MKRAMAGTMLIVGALLVPGGPAQAKVDPIKALQAQFVAGRGVKLKTVLQVRVKGGKGTVTQELGAVRFGAKGAVASDLSEKTRYDKGYFNESSKDERETKKSLERPGRVISLPKVTYVQGPRAGEGLPEGKYWVRKRPIPPVPSGIIISVFEPNTVKTLIARAASVRGGVVKGSTTSAKMAALSPVFRKQYGPGGKSESGQISKITYAFSLNSEGLITRLSVKLRMPVGDGTVVDYSSVTRLYNWGAKVSVSAPPADAVADEKDLNR